MKTRIAILVFLLSMSMGNISSQNTPWDYIYCLNGGENKSAGILKLPVPNPVAKPGWNLIFKDEFQSDSLDPAKWNRSIPGDDKPDTCLRGFAINPENIIGRSGKAEILNTVDSQLPGCPYSFGEIKTMSILDSTFNSYYFYPPGYLETRVKLFTKTGQGAACWLWGVGTPESPGTPGPWNEIDIFELNGVNSNVFTGTYHWTYDTTHVSQNHRIYLTESGQPYDLSDNWTTFGLEWDTVAIRWFVNNQLVKELELSRIPPYCLSVPRYTRPVFPMSIRFNTGNNSVGNQSATPTPADFPQSMIIDYVRAYKKNVHKASPIIVNGGNQICATATTPESSGKIIRTNYYPEVQYDWSSPAFDMQEVSSPNPQPPGKMLIWIKPGVVPGQSYPVFLTVRFPGGYTEHDTTFIYIAPGQPAPPPDYFYTSQVDSLCRFEIQYNAFPDITGCDYSLDGGLTWIAGTVTQGTGIVLCRFGNFKPGTEVNFGFRVQNSCGYSQPRFSSLLTPSPPVNCKWPTGLSDTLIGQPGSATSAVSILPNPVSGIMTVRITDKINLHDHAIDLMIFDLYARKVAEMSLSEPNTEIDLTALNQGIYFCKVSNGGEILFKSTFIKK